MFLPCLEENQQGAISTFHVSPPPLPFPFSSARPPPVVGNNGAMAVSLSYRDTSFCFVSASLTSQHSKFITRNDQARAVHDAGQSWPSNIEKCFNMHNKYLWVEYSAMLFSMCMEKVENCPSQRPLLFEARCFSASDTCNDHSARRLSRGCSSAPTLWTFSIRCV